MVNNGRDLSSLLLPALIIISIGLVGIVAWLIWVFTRGEQSHPDGGGIASSPHPTAEVNPTAVSPQVAAVEPLGDVSASVADTPSYFLAVSRSRTGAWQIYVRGERYFTLDSVPDAETQAQVVAAIKALALFARDYMKRGTSTAGAEGAADAEPRFTSAPRSTAASAASASPASHRSPQPSMIPTIDLAQEVGDIVDDMLKREPTLAGHSVRLFNAPKGGISFAVDGVIYHDLAEIPNSEIRSLIRRATKEWERR